MDRREIFFALGDPTRFEIVQTLAREGPIAATDISKRFHSSRSAVSQHLKILKDAQLVDSETQARFRIYHVSTKGFELMEEWMIGIRQQWAKNRHQ